MPARQGYVLPRGMRGSIREVDGDLHLLVQMPNGKMVEYRYHLDPESSGRVMGVDISVLGAPRLDPCPSPRR